MNFQIGKRCEGKQILEASRRVFQNSGLFEAGPDFKWEYKERLFPKPYLSKEKTRGHRVYEPRSNWIVYRGGLSPERAAELHDVFYAEKWAQEACQEDLVQYRQAENGQIERYFPYDLGNIAVYFQKSLLSERKTWVFWGREKKYWYHDGSFIVLWGENTEDPIYGKGTNPDKEYSVICIETGCGIDDKWLAEFLNELLEELGK